jgi:PAS domain-containing protein
MTADMINNTDEVAAKRPAWLEAPLLPEGVITGERASAQELAGAVEQFEQQPLLPTFLDAVPNIVLVLNETRQIVYANRRLLCALGCTDPAEVCGLRPGELFGCVHASEGPDGCGTTEFCRTCGAVRAILGSLLGHEMVEECHILRTDNDALEFRVWTTPLTIHGRPYTIFSLSDITHEKRRAVLERVFFHDLLNLAGALQGFAEYLNEADPNEVGDIRETIARLTNRLTQEIRSQQLLAAAERGDLEVMPTEVSALELLHEVADAYRLHPAAQERTIVVDAASADARMITDRALLSRVIENMVKNALEAIAPGDTVTLRARPQSNGVRLEVHNPGAMPPEVRLQIFKRSYTTKGRGRGIGTYSMKLLTEKYLGGRISFESTAEAGTTFFVDLPTTVPAAAAD